jgi:cardiolipin synthase C
VRVRILVDFSKPVFRLEPIYARYLKSRGVEVRYYNTAPIYRLVSSQHRSHRKLLIADGSSFITGGRNIADEYFDMSEDYRFLDTDVEIRGPIAEAALRSFDLYWGSELSRPVDEIDRPLTSDEENVVNKFITAKPGDELVIRAAKSAKMPRSHHCSDLSFVTDFPSHGESNRKVFNAIMKELSAAEEHVVAESPYFVIKRGGYDGIEQLTKRGVNLQVLTNSLSSTDAFYTVAALILKMPWLSRSGIELYVYHDPPNGDGVRYGLHSKRAVIDGRTTLIGTYNIDPRSANLNSEVMVVCRNQPEFAGEVVADWKSRQQHAVRVIGERDYQFGPVLANATGGQIAMTLLTLPLSNLFDFLL